MIRHQARSGSGDVERGLQAFDVALGPPSEHFDEQIVERPEVVVQLDAGFGLDPSGGHGRVPVAEHDPLGGVEESSALLGGGGSRSPRLGHAWLRSTHDGSAPGLTAGLP